MFARLNLWPEIREKHKRQWFSHFFFRRQGMSLGNGARFQKNNQVGFECACGTPVYACVWCLQDALRFTAVQLRNWQHLNNSTTWNSFSLFPCSLLSVRQFGCKGGEKTQSNSIVKADLNVCYALNLQVPSFVIFDICIFWSSAVSICS